MNSPYPSIADIPGVQEQHILAPYTTFKIGGPADYFVVARTADELAAAVQTAIATETPFFILGGGSDVLIADAGYRGLVIKSEVRMVDIDEDAAQITAGSGVLMSALIRKTLAAELTGLEYAIGVPATLGGAIWANLGARGHELSEFVIDVDVIDAAGKRRTLTNEECAFSYRESIFKQESFTILSARLQLATGERSEIAAQMKELADKRKSTQDVGAWCAGCIFRNPTDQTDISAGQLIDELGLKGFAIGGAAVSETHGNFILNTGEATADEVVQLISYIKQQVRDKRGIQLMEEVEYIGFE